MLSTYIPSNIDSKYLRDSEFYRPNLCNQFASVVIDAHYALGEFAELKTLGYDPIVRYETFLKLAKFPKNLVNSEYARYVMTNNSELNKLYLDYKVELIALRRVANGKVEWAYVRPMAEIKSLEVIEKVKLKHFINMNDRQNVLISDIFNRCSVIISQIVRQVYIDMLNTNYYLENMLVPKLYGIGRLVFLFF